MAERGSSLTAPASTSRTSLAELASGAPLTLGLIFLVMLKIGVTMFGGGYVLVAFLRSDLVLRLKWLSGRPLLERWPPGRGSTAAARNRACSLAAAGFNG